MSQTLEKSVATNGSQPVTRAENKATDARLAVLEQRIKNVADASEERTSVLRDASEDFIAAELEARDQEIVSLKARITDLEHKLDQQIGTDKQVTLITAKLAAWQAARDESKRGPRGERGERGQRGEQGPQGLRGPAGKATDPAKSIRSWHVDRKTYRVIPFLSNGKPLPALDLRPLFEAFVREIEINSEG